MKLPFVKCHKNFLVSGLLLSFCLMLVPVESQANFDCSLEKETICRVENNWESLLNRGIPGETMKPPSYEQYAHRQGGCDTDAMPSDDMGCMHGRGRHQQGMHGMHGRHRESGAASAQCPQRRATVSAPQLFLEMKNPLEKSDANIEQGRLLFQQNAEPSCALCHGMSGDGLGQMGAALVPPPRNFTCADTMDSVSDGQLFWIIKNGSEGTGMPAFGNLNEESIWQVILYIRQFAQ